MLGYAGVWVSMEWRVVKLWCSVLCGVAPGRECGELPHSAASCPILSAWGVRGGGSKECSFGQDWSLKEAVPGMLIRGWCWVLAVGLEVRGCV